VNIKKKSAICIITISALLATNFSNSKPANASMFESTLNFLKDKATSALSLPGITFTVVTTPIPTSQYAPLKSYPYMYPQFYAMKECKQLGVGNGGSFLKWKDNKGTCFSYHN
jgi:hypothetical protein